jgi:hypothetical protein
MNMGMFAKKPLRRVLKEFKFFEVIVPCQKILKLNSFKLDSSLEFLCDSYCLSINNIIADKRTWQGEQTIRSLLFRYLFFDIAPSKTCRHGLGVRIFHCYGWKTAWV